MSEELSLFQKLCIKIVTEPEFGGRLLGDDGMERHLALQGFLDEQEFTGDYDQALDDLITAFAKMDMEAIGKLRGTLEHGAPERDAVQYVPI